MSGTTLRFTKDHEWVAFTDASAMATIGITDFAAGELGDIVFVELPEVGRKVKSAESVGTIEAVKTVADLFTPVSGVVRETNDELKDHPELINKSPYDQGWFLKIEMSDPSELKSLMTRADYDKLIGKE
jgi:glycine cleavage system H protein